MLKEFSANKQTVSALVWTSLHEETVNALAVLRMIKDALQVCYENNVTKITRNVTSALLASARIAYSKYKRYQEEQARQELEEKRKAEVKKAEEEQRRQEEL
jgi:uncharacterized membrane protein YebE (DUF533 family)